MFGGKSKVFIERQLASAFRGVQIKLKIYMQWKRLSLKYFSFGLSIFKSEKSSFSIKKGVYNNSTASHWALVRLAV